MDMLDEITRNPRAPVVCQLKVVGLDGNYGAFNDADGASFGEVAMENGDSGFVVEHVVFAVFDSNHTLG